MIGQLPFCDLIMTLLELTGRYHFLRNLEKFNEDEGHLSLSFHDR
jgi:hypothetical protein